MLSYSTFSFLCRRFARPTFNLQKTLHVGDIFISDFVINKKNTYNPTKNQCDNVYATSELIDHVEYVCSSNLEKDIAKDHASVGFFIEVDHKKPVHIGELVHITAKVVHVDNRKATFRTSVFNNSNELISSGTHKRALIKSD